ncbi:hypothetical protein BU23DRAFT_142794 [Bimuria novae-zelandiae CBS 107.79]|uniref:Uncharacterized protein n=1 Tax=Bimuria novae-zelandiae CBS 107.79 TaxID=1447943 RepID=A0A6A5V8B1_9PLEO|nr:hypothetical protein BU23DRAFT_142794 [Bimuria novae-zelandiae CBS 107.79]
MPDRDILCAPLFCITHYVTASSQVVRHRRQVPSRQEGATKNLRANLSASSDVVLRCRMLTEPQHRSSLSAVGREIPEKTRYHTMARSPLTQLLLRLLIRCLNRDCIAIWGRASNTYGGSKCVMETRQLYSHK